VERSVALDGSASDRAHALARSFAALFTEDRVLCDLLSAETPVLEQNVSEEVALRYKRGG
jgi:hypothetical protein